MKIFDFHLARKTLFFGKAQFYWKSSASLEKLSLPVPGTRICKQVAGGLANLREGVRWK